MWTRVADKVVRNKQNAEDMVQDSFISVALMPKESIALSNAYFSRTVFNKSLNFAQRDKLTILTDDITTSAAAHDKMILETTPESDMASNEIFAASLEFAKTLPVKQRHVFEHIYIKEWSLRDYTNEFSTHYESTKTNYRIALKRWAQYGRKHVL